jgi:hypothetical protein
LNSETFKSEFKNCPLVYIEWHQNLEKQQNFRRLLEILDIKFENLRCVDCPTQFDKIILPDESFFGSRYRKFTNEYRETIDRIRDFALRNQTPTSAKKIYYFYGRNQVGEERLAECFRERGYDIISPEKLTFDEQLNLLINCESFVSTLGSISHNSIFLRDNTEAIFLTRIPGYLTLHQPALNQMRPLKATYIDTSLSIFDRWGIFRQNCHIFTPQLKKFFGEKFDGYAEEDFKNFLQLVKTALSKGISINPNIASKNVPILPDFMEQLTRHEDLIAAYNMPQGWEKFQPLLTYQTHVASKGWGSWLEENSISNPLDQQRNLQAIKISFTSHKIFYAVYYNEKEGWSEEVTYPEQAGTTGKSKPIYGIRIRLDEAGTKKFDILYRVHKFDDTWTDWVKNGEVIYSYGVQINAIQIKLETKT